MRACVRGARRGLRRAQLANRRRDFATRQEEHPPKRDKVLPGDRQGGQATQAQAKPGDPAGAKGAGGGSPAGSPAHSEPPRGGLPPWAPVAAAVFGFGSLAYLGGHLATGGALPSVPSIQLGPQNERQSGEGTVDAALETAKKIDQPVALIGPGGERGEGLGAGTPTGDGGGAEAGVSEARTSPEEVVVIDAAPLDQLFSDALGMSSSGGGPDGSVGLAAGNASDDQANAVQTVEASEDSTSPDKEEVLMATPSPLPTPAQSITADLVWKVIDQGAGAGEDWEKYKIMHEQATHDAESVIEKMAEQEAEHKVQTSQLESKIAEHAAMVEDIRAEAKEQLKKTQALLEKQEEVAEQQRENELKRQAEYMTVAASEAAVKERIERLGLIDQVRENLNVLEEAFVQRSKDALQKRAVHNVALGAMALDQALQEGLPCSKPLQFLHSGCGQDPVVLTGLGAVPTEVAQHGVSTQAELLDRFKDVKKSVLTLSYLPPEGGGVLAHLVAKIGAALKVRELPTPPGSLDAALSEIEEMVKDGRLAPAVRSLEATTVGTAAEGCAKDWLEAARSRAAAEQTVKMLQARAMSLTVALL